MLRILSILIFLPLSLWYLLFTFINIYHIDTDMGCVWEYSKKLVAWTTTWNCLYEFKSWLYHIDDCGIYQDKNWKFLVNNVRQVGTAEGCDYSYDKDKFTPLAYYANTILNEHRCMQTKLYIKHFYN